VETDHWGVGAPPDLAYVDWTRLWEGFEDQVVELVRSSGADSVGELGGGANPMVGLSDRVGRHVDFTVLDISAAELDRAPAHVQKLCVDLCANEPPVDARFDVVFSRMLCEHVPSGESFHRNCYAALRPGGYALHFFPAVTTVPSVVNRLAPGSLSRRLLDAVQTGRTQSGKHAKFPAAYSWCWGPTARQLKRYRSVGFEVVRADVGIGHGYYRRIPGLRSLERAKTSLVLRHPTPWLAGCVVVLLRRPPNERRGNGVPQGS
jgi:SAM-dependent methyltransferase